MYRKAPFIWIDSQDVNPMGMLANAFGTPPRDDGQNRWYFFRREIMLPEKPNSAAFTITSDGKYQLFVNGVRVGRGPVRSDPMFQRTDSYDIASHLRQGTNAIGVLVHVPGVSMSTYQQVRGEWRTVFGDGALYCDGAAVLDGETISLATGPDWRALKSDAWNAESPRMLHGLDFIEELDGAKLPVGWAEPGFDDSAWNGVRVLFTGEPDPGGAFGGGMVWPFPYLQPSEIPPLRETPGDTPDIIYWAGVTSGAELPVIERIYQQEHGPLPSGAVEAPKALTQANETATQVRTADREGVTVLLRFPRIATGFPFIEIDAEGGEEIDIAVAEGLDGEFDGALADRPRVAVKESALGVEAHVARYRARPGRQRFDWFSWTAVRWMQVTVRHAPNGLKIVQAGLVDARYPAEQEGSFTSSDEMLDRLWATGAYTLHLCMHDAWEDCPSREQRQWLGDATVEHLVGQAAFGPSIPALNRKYLRQVAENQRNDGLTDMAAPGDAGEFGLYIPDWTLQWILNAGDHYLYTADLDTIEEIFPAIQRALAWFERHIGASGLMARLPYWNFSDWAAHGRWDEAGVANGLMIGCLKSTARLAEALEYHRAARRYSTLADKMSAAFNDRLWDERRGIYVDIVHPETGAQDPRVSQHTNALAILFDIAPQDRWPRMVKWIADPARLKFTRCEPIQSVSEPFDPETDCVLANTFFSHFVFEALAKAGHFSAALDLVRQRFVPMLERGATTLWENFEPTASLCHGFSATPTYQLSTKVLGVSPLEPGFRRFRFDPDLADLHHAEGTVPTIRGPIHVKLARETDGIAAEIEVPEGTEAWLAGTKVSAGAPSSPLGPGQHRLTLATTLAAE